MSVWEVESFTPSDGVRRADGFPPDHQAWLRCRYPEAPSDYMHLQFSTWKIDAAQAKQLVETIAQTLTALQSGGNT